MTCDARLRPRYPPRWRTLCAVALGSALPAAHASLWSLERNVEARFEMNDNVALVPKPSGTVTTFAVSTALAVINQMENTGTRANLAVTALKQQGRAGNDRIDANLGLTQTFSDEVNSVSLSATYAQDFNNVVQNADVTVGRGKRRNSTLQASWSRSLTERLSVGTQLSTSRISYDEKVSSGDGFRNTAVSGGFTYRLTEVDTVTLQASRSDYRNSTGTNDSVTNDLSLGWSSALTERISASLRLGVYRTERTQRFKAFGEAYCPVQAELCLRGLIPTRRRIVNLRNDTATTGLLYSSGYNWQFDERTGLNFTSGRQQSPTGSGTVVRSSTLNLGLNHAFSETFSGTASYAQSRSSYEKLDGGGSAFQQSFGLSLNKQLTPELNLQFGAQMVRANNRGPNNSADSTSFSMALKYEWQKFDATR
jgi:hypothetical protein